MGEMDPDLVRPPGLELAAPRARRPAWRRCPLIGRPALPNGSPPRVRPGAPPSSRGHAGGGRAARRRVPRWPAGRTPGEGDDSRAASRPVRPWSANCAGQRLHARWSFLADHQQPRVVSLSSRCTMPGRRTPPIPERLAPQWAISALTSVPAAWPAAGCTTRPRACR